jgi:kumamolisin
VMALAAASGISVTVSTGDNGYAGCARIVPAAIPATAIPSTVPHVTAVGGTNLLLSDDNHILRESAWTDAPAGVGALGGGGGRSLLFARPWYQKASGVSGYDRLVPDVSALADPVPGYVIYCTAPSCAGPSLPQGGWQTIGGTSAATPLVASGLVLADQAARRAGQPPLGFVNPLVYALARGSNPGFVLNDVVIGSNDVGVALPADAGGGSASGFFKARKGYDEATGLGSLKFAALNALALRAGRRTAR